MGTVGFETLAVLLVLLPGFLAAGIVRALCVRTKQTEFDKLIEALVFSFIAYGAFVAVFRRFPLQSGSVGDVREYLTALHPSDVLFLLAFGAAAGLLVGGSITNDFHGKVFRKLRLTNRTSRPSIWLDVFSEIKDYVQLEFQDGRKLIGWPRYFSDTPDESCLFLENAAWIGHDGKTIEVPGSGVLVTKEMPIQAIMFLRENRKPPESSPAKSM